VGCYTYPLFVSAGSTIGLSEISPFGQTAEGGEVFAITERDNRDGLPDTHKRIYAFPLPSASCAANDSLATGNAKGAQVSKELFRDIEPDFAPLEKVEALAMSATGDVWVALDNDGGEVEPRLIRIRR
jgi:hypothetical protein